MPRFVSPFTPRSQHGETLSNVMMAMFPEKAAGNTGHSSRTQSQDARDLAEAEKAAADAALTRSILGGRENYMQNRAAALVPGDQVPLVMNRLKTGQWDAFEDPQRQQSVVPGVGPSNWKPEYDTELTDAARISANLLGSNTASFKDLNEATMQPMKDRRMEAITSALFGAPRAPAPQMPQQPAFNESDFGSFKMPNQASSIYDVLPNLSADQEIKAINEDLRVAQTPSGPRLTTPMDAALLENGSASIPETVITGVRQEPLDLEAIVKAAMQLSTIDPAVANSLVGGVNSARQIREMESKADQEGKGFVWQKGRNPASGKVEYVRIGPTGMPQWSGVEVPPTDPLINQQFGGLTEAIDTSGKPAFIRVPKDAGPAVRVEGFFPPPSESQIKREEDEKNKASAYQSVQDTIARMRKIIEEHPAAAASWASPTNRLIEGMHGTIGAFTGNEVPAEEMPALAIRQMKEALIVQLTEMKGRRSNAFDKRLDTAIGQLNSNTPAIAKQGLDLAEQLNAQYNATGSGPVNQPQSSIPPATIEAPPSFILKEGVATKFKNGQTWTLRNGRPQRLDQ